VGEVWLATGAGYLIALAGTTPPKDDTFWRIGPAIARVFSVARYRTTSGLFQSARPVLNVCGGWPAKKKLAAELSRCDLARRCDNFGLLPAKACRGTLARWRGQLTRTWGQYYGTPGPNQPPGGHGGTVRSSAGRGAVAGVSQSRDDHRTHASERVVGNGCSQHAVHRSRKRGAWPL
jgi:hypothetical protein